MGDASSMKASAGWSSCSETDEQGLRSDFYGVPHHRIRSPCETTGEFRVCFEIERAYTIRSGLLERSSVTPGQSTTCHRTPKIDWPGKADPRFLSPSAVSSRMQHLSLASAYPRELLPCPLNRRKGRTCQF